MVVVVFFPHTFLWQHQRVYESQLEHSRQCVLRRHDDKDGNEDECNIYDTARNYIFVGYSKDIEDAATPEELKHKNTAEKNVNWF